MFHFFQRAARAAHKAINPPQHIRLSAVEESLDECLRKLEDAAGLPDGDLSLRGDTREVATFPTGHRGVQHVIVSKTSDKWKADVTKVGYISGSITVFPGRIGEEKTCLGKLHISKNCAGVYRDNVCTTCGDVSR